MSQSMELCLHMGTAIKTSLWGQVIQSKVQVYNL